LYRNRIAFYVSRIDQIIGIIADVILFPSSPLGLASSPMSSSSHHRRFASTLCAGAGQRLSQVSIVLLLLWLAVVWALH